MNTFISFNIFLFFLHFFHILLCKGKSAYIGANDDGSRGSAFLGWRIAIIFFVAIAEMVRIIPAAKKSHLVDTIFMRLQQISSGF